MLSCSPFFRRSDRACCSNRVNGLDRLELARDEFAIAFTSSVLKKSTAPDTAGYNAAML